MIIPGTQMRFFEAFLEAFLQSAWKNHVLEHFLKCAAKDEIFRGVFAKCRERSYFLGRFPKVPGKIISHRAIFHSAYKYMIFCGTLETACKNQYNNFIILLVAVHNT
jgi:hypothetical protein